MKKTVAFSSIILFLLVTSCKESYQAINYLDNSKYYEIEAGVFVSISKIGTDISHHDENYYYYPKKGFIYYLADLKLFNQSNTETKIDVSNFRLQDSNGDLHDIVFFRFLGVGKPNLEPKDYKIRSVIFEYPLV